MRQVRGELSECVPALLREAWGVSQGMRMSVEESGSAEETYFTGNQREYRERRQIV